VLALAAWPYSDGSRRGLVCLAGLDRVVFAPAEARAALESPDQLAGRPRPSVLEDEPEENTPCGDGGGVPGGVCRGAAGRGG
jgi:hypothetical protein